MGCCNSTVVAAPVEDVWAAVRDFHNMSAFPNVIQSVNAVGDTLGTQIGAKRVLNGVFHETLVALDDDARVLRYSIDDGPEAVSKDNVSGYIGELSLYPVTDGNHTFFRGSLLKLLKLLTQTSSANRHRVDAKSFQDLRTCR